MHKLRAVCGLVALACAGSAMAAPNSAYYVVVPVKARVAGVDNIRVTLGGSVLPSGLVGTTYPGFNFKQLLRVTGDSKYTGYGVRWTVSSGRLPAGLTLNSDGTLTGTPTERGTSSFSVQATYQTKTGESAYEVVVGSITVGLGAAAPAQALVGQAYSYDLKPLLSVSGDSAYNGSGVTWSVVSSSLPAGLSLRADGTIAGVPTAAGSGTVTARATYRGQNGEQTYQVVSLNITVSLAAANPPQAVIGQEYSYDLKPLLSVSGDNAYTGSDVTWSVVSNTLPPGLTLRADGTISGTPTAAGTGSIIARASYRGRNGEQTYQVVADLNITVRLAAPTPPQALVGQAYSYDLKPFLSVTGDPAYAGSGVTWSVVSGTLPAGLSLRSDGTLAGTPTAAGSASITARASYKGRNGEQTFQVVGLNITVGLATATPPSAIVGQAYSYDLKPLLSVSGDSAYSGSGVTWRLASGTLPAGLTLSTNGVITGTPTGASTGTVTAQATYRGVNGQRAYQVVSLAISVRLGAATPPYPRVGEPYSYDLKQNLTVTGDASYTSAAVAWSQVGGTLPAGLSLGANGVISGTPTAQTTNSLTAQAAYRNVMGQQTYSFTTQPAFTYAWAADAYDYPYPEFEIPPCGESYRLYRYVWCERSDGTEVSDAKCTGTKPRGYRTVTNACPV